VNPVRVGQTLYAICQWDEPTDETVVKVVTPKTIRAGRRTFSRSNDGTAVAASPYFTWYASPEDAAAALIATLRDDASRLNHRADVLAEKHLGGAA